MPDLFVKKRGQNGELELTPTSAFGDGKTAEQKLQEADSKIIDMERQLAQTNTDFMAFVEFTMSGGL